jgi:hypothetical protein
MVAACPTLDVKIYQPRRPRVSPLWKCVHDHFGQFQAEDPDRYAAKCGPLRPVVDDVVERFRQCGDLHEGFARVRCPDCRLEYLLAFSCKTRGFCPSCQQRRTVQTAQVLVEDVFAVVPHCHYVLSLPVALRTFFQRDRSLLKDLCRLANESLREWMQTAVNETDSAPGVVLTRHTFGDYLNFHPHIHAIATDGLFERTGTFTPLPKAQLRHLRDLFRAKVFRLLVQRKLLSPALVHKFIQWKHSGFNLFRGDPVPGTHRAELEKMAQYILRHSFAVEKMTYFPDTGRVIYHSRLNPSTRRNFEVFTATDFLAAVTQHIPEKGAQTVKYYGYYSNKARGQRAKAVGRAGLPHTTAASGSALGCPGQPLPVESAMANPQCRNPKRIPTHAWRELIKRAWDVDPLLCPKCGGQMRLISLIEEDEVIEKILRHLDLWEGPVRCPARAPPLRLESELTREPFDDDLPFGPDSYAE